MVPMGQDGSTPLLVAVKGSYDSIVKALLEAHANVNMGTAVGVMLGIWD